MSEADAGQQTFDFALDSEGFRPEVQKGDRTFELWLLTAFLLHALLLVSIQRMPQRQLGDPSGVSDAISVSLVTSADLKGRATVEDSAAGAKAPPLPPVKTEEPRAVPPETSPPPPEAAAPENAPPAPEPQKAEPIEPQPEKADATLPRDPVSEPQREPQPVQKAEAPPAPESLTLPDLDEGLNASTPDKAESKPEADKKVDPPKNVASESSPPAEKPQPKPAAQDKPRPAKPDRPRTAALDLTPPRTPFAASGSGGAGVERPAGITRSGENDAFARGVIRALQQTMPQLSNTYGRVTVRIVLDQNGNLVSTTVLKPSKVAGLDQSVVFATKQSSFPFPPRNANQADLTFFITYVYK